VTIISSFWISSTNRYKNTRRWGKNNN
jgi:hypothetical protein